MNIHYTYFLVLAASLAGPLALSFDKKVAFYKNWKYLFPGLLFTALVFITWDVYFTAWGVWSFNEMYNTGLKLGNLPVEEILFFLVIPYDCVFIYECIRVYYPGLNNNPVASWFLQLLAIILFITGIIHYDRLYTSRTFLFTAIFIGFIFIGRKYGKRFHALYFLVSFLIILIPFLLVNGVLTVLPVIEYNDAENLGIRIFTIPIEDTVYGMLMVMINVVIYEALKKRA